MACLLAGSRPGRRGTFLCFAKEKYPKERRAGFVDPLRGHAALLGLSGVRANSLRSNMRAPFSAQPCATRLLITAMGTQYPIPRNQDAPWRVLVGFGCWVSGFPCGCAEARRSGRIKRDACLSPQGEFAALPPAASTAGCPGAAGVTDTRVAFSLVTFFWRSKRKLLRCRAHIPATPRRRTQPETEEEKPPAGGPSSTTSHKETLSPA